MAIDGVELLSMRQGHSLRFQWCCSHCGADLLETKVPDTTSLTELERLSVLDGQILQIAKAHHQCPGPEAG
jgi:hypothetical protein